MESADRPMIIHFGVFEVDLRSDELFKDGHKIKIQEQPFQILAALLEHPGEVVTREELQHKLWPEDTFVDFDHSLNTAVRLLRLALGDAAENPKFVETLPRKGYRFIYPVESADPRAAEAAQTCHPAGQQPFESSGHAVSSEATELLHSPPLSQLPHARETVQAQPEYHSTPELGIDGRGFELGTEPGEETELNKKHWHGWAVVTLGVLMVAVGTVYWMIRRGATEPESALFPVPFTAYPGMEWNPSFSPDGNQVAFAWTGEKMDNWDIYIKQIGTESLRRLTTDPHVDCCPAWSPDVQSIAFLRFLDHDQRAAVMMIPANGGRERQVAALRMMNTEGFSRMLCWHPSGKWLAVSCDQDSADAPAAIFLLSPETHEKHRLTLPPKGVRVDTNPAFSPDGRSLVFARYFEGDTSEIYLLRVSAGLLPEGEPRQLTSMNQDTCFPAWMPDGKEIIFASGSKSHACRLWRIPVSGSNLPRPLPFSSEVNGLAPAISLEKHRLVYTVFSMESNIWRCEIPKGEAKPESPQRILASTRVQENVQYSPDGKAIAYCAWASGSEEIWVCDKNGSNPLQLTHLGGPIPGPPRWFPDGQKIIFALASRGENDLYAIPAQGGEMRQLTHTPFNELNPSYSRNGKWIYFGSDGNGEFQVWKMPTKGGDAVQVTQKGGSHPQESIDRKMLFYLKPIEPDLDELWKVPVEGGEECRVLEKVFRWNFEVKEHGIYYASQPDPNMTSFLFYDLANRKTKPIAAIQDTVGLGFTVSPDEQRILYIQVGNWQSDLMLVENFR